MNRSNDTSSPNEYEDAKEGRSPTEQIFNCYPPTTPSNIYPINGSVIDKTDSVILNSYNRRQRLNLLRSRMRNEFGHGNISGGGITPSCTDDDTLSLSESASLASWGRNLLSESGNSFNKNVFALDSLSTRGLTMKMGSSLSPSKSYTDQQQQLTNYYMEGPKMSAHQIEIPPIPVETIPEETNTKTYTTPRNNSAEFDAPNVTLKSTTQRQSDLFRDNDSLTSDKLTENEREDEDKISEMPGKHTTASDSKESISGTSDPNNEYGRRRGHVKTNSLDRGLSLAKVMKSGPFPPPDQKANSLNRQCSPSEIFKVMCEEDQLNDQAAGVVSKITSDLLKTDPSIKSSGETCHSTDTTDNSKSIELALTPPIPDRSHLPILTKPRPVIPPRPSRPSTIIEQQQNTLENFIIEEEVEMKKIGEDKEERGKSSNGSSDTYKSMESITIPKEALLDTCDPITRDVERRMSMKEHTPASSKSSTLDKGATLTPSTSQTIPVTLSALRGAKNTVKNISHGLLRGVFDKAKSAVFLGRNNPKISRSEFEEMHEIDDDPATFTNNLPPEQQVPPSSVSSPIQICRPKNSKKGPFDFSDVQLVQQINNEHSGAIWVVKFSVCGKLIATAGKDGIVRVWCMKDAVEEFQNMKERYRNVTGRSSASGSNYELMLGANSKISNSSSTVNDVNNLTDDDASVVTVSNSSDDKKKTSKAENVDEIISGKPLCTYRGHTSDIVDLSWSKSYFILSSGNDKTVKLWHLSRNECLCCFQHMDFVTGVAFLPKDDKYFISGSMDGKVRLWHIPDKKVVLWNEVEGSKFITALTFVKNGKYIVVGTYVGQCFFFTTEQLQYYTMIDVRSTKGKNAVGHKITGLSVSGDKLLVTSNDSRIRIYDIRDMKLSCKFIGSTNDHSHIRASFSPDGKHIICGSEDRHIYIWKTFDSSSTITVRKDRNTMWERIRGHEHIVSVAIFAPKPNLFLKKLLTNKKLPVTKSFNEKSNNKNGGGNVESVGNPETELDASVCYQPIFKSSLPPQASEASTTSITGKEKIVNGDLIVSADFNGSIKIFINPPRIISTCSSSYFNGE
uniref:WD repeat-containing protein 44 n=1 Tax=Strongyloides venezuelensis TaxID=75913 RepID=A0A0K0F1R0_STRVS